jgi:hypothetical protein
MPAGRPSDYTDDIAAEAWAYIENYEEYGHAVPSVVGLCKVINRAKSTIYDWAKDEDKQFSDILAAINENQELVTFNKSLKNEYNATIAKLLLGKHGYHDKQDVSATVTELSHEEWLNSLE